MTIEVKCPKCGKHLRIPDKYAGQRGGCNSCGSRIIVPTLDDSLKGPNAAPIESDRGTTKGPHSGSHSENVVRDDASAPTSKRNIVLVVLAVVAIILVVSSFVIAPRALEELAWRDAIAEKTAASYSEYIESHPNGKHTQEAERLFDESSWSSAEEVGTASAYEAYLSRHEEGAHAIEAEERLDEFAWSTAQAIDADESYRAYLSQFSEGRHASQAQSMVSDFSWQEALHEGSVETLQSYLNEFPQGRYATDVTKRMEELIWNREEAHDTIASYETYLEAYPEGRFRKDAEAMLVEIREAQITFDPTLSSDPLSGSMERGTTMNAFGGGTSSLAVDTNTGKFSLSLSTGFSEFGGSSYLNSDRVLLLVDEKLFHPKRFVCDFLHEKVYELSGENLTENSQGGIVVDSRKWSLTNEAVVRVQYIFSYSTESIDGCDHKVVILFGPTAEEAKHILGLCFKGKDFPMPTKWKLIPDGAEDSSKSP